MLLGASVGVAAVLGLAHLNPEWHPTSNRLWGRGTGNLQRDATDVVLDLSTRRNESVIVACLNTGATAPLNLQDYGRQRTRDRLLINLPRAAVIFIADDGSHRVLTMKARPDRPLDDAALAFVRRCAGVY